MISAHERDALAVAAPPHTVLDSGENDGVAGVEYGTGPGGNGDRAARAKSKRRIERKRAAQEEAKRASEAAERALARHEAATKIQAGIRGRLARRDAR